MIDAADLRSLCLLSAVRPAGAAEPYSPPPLIGGGPRSGNLSQFTAIRRASSRVSRFGRRAMRRSDMPGIASSALFEDQQTSLKSAKNRTDWSEIFEDRFLSSGPTPLAWHPVSGGRSTT
jgi:hypothetical protein